MIGHIPVLTLLVLLPLLGGLAALFSGRGAGRPRHAACRWICLGTVLADLALTLGLWAFSGRLSGSGPWLLVEDAAWIPSLSIRYTLAMDGVSLALAALTCFLGALMVLTSWRGVAERVRAYHFLLMAALTGVLGVFLATDLVLFYLFWELQLLPIFFLIGLWGHEDRIRATVKFVLFSIAGSLLMLAAILGLHVIHGTQTGTWTFALAELAHTGLSPHTGMWLFAAFALAFGIKIPLVPVHTWLPDAHTQAPTAGSVILAGLLLKTGAYGLYRFAFPLFPEAARAAAPTLYVLALAGLFYAAWIAFAQRDMKRLVAYSSISHMAVVVIGLAAWNQATLSGAVLQMVSHGLTTSGLFILVGLLDERTRSRELADYGGLWSRAPVLSFFLLLFSLASLGLPGLANFVGELLVLGGTFPDRPLVGALGFLGTVPALAYGLRLVQDLLFGQPRVPAVVHKVHDLTGREAAVLVPLALAVLVVGLHPAPLLDLFQAPVQAMAECLRRPGERALPSPLDPSPTRGNDSPWTPHLGRDGEGHGGTSRPAGVLSISISTDGDSKGGHPLWQVGSRGGRRPLLVGEVQERVKPSPGGVQGQSPWWRGVQGGGEAFPLAAGGMQP